MKDQKSLSALKKFIVVGTASVLCSTMLALPSVSATPGSDFTTAYSATTGTLLTESLWMGIVNNVATLMDSIAGITNTSGNVKATASTDTCDGTIFGTLRSTGSTVEFCDGTDWSAMGGAGGTDDEPINFSFTPQTIVARSTTITSNDVIVAGFDGPLTAYCGTNCLQVRRNDGTWGASASGFMPGDTITIQLTSSSLAGTEVLANVNLGNTTSTNWSVTTDTCDGGTVAGRAPDVLTYATVRAGDGKCWTATNLGTTNVASSEADTTARGWFVQWGRKIDGHQESTSLTDGTQIAWDYGGSDKYYMSGGPEWATGDDDTTNRKAGWGAGGVNNPCPVGYHVPTKVEMEAVIGASPTITNSATAFSNPLKLISTGFRDQTGGINAVSSCYWTSFADTAGYAWNLYGTPGGGSFMNGGVASSQYRSFGCSVRCIED